MNHNEHPITVIIGIGLLIALGLLPFYCKSFMAWIYIAICCVIVVGLIGFVLHLRHNQKIKQENREALAPMAYWEGDSYYKVFLTDNLSSHT